MQKYTINIAAILVFVVVTFLYSSLVNGKNIRVFMSSMWEETSYLQEVCETAAAFTLDHPGHIGQAAFWRCEEALGVRILSLDSNNTSNNNNINNNNRKRTLDITPRQAYEIAIGVLNDGNVMTPGGYNLALLALNSRQYSPTIAGSIKLFDATKIKSNSNIDTCLGNKLLPKLVTGDGNVYCGESAYNAIDNNVLHRQAIIRRQQQQQHNSVNITEGNSPLRRLPSDHIFAAVDGALPVAVVYGELGSPATHIFLSKIKKAVYGMAENDSVAFIFRHAKEVSNRNNAEGQAHGSSVGRRLGVQGYGVFLDIKNMEYKTLDDVKKNKVSTGLPTGGLGENVVESINYDNIISGLNITRLSQRLTSSSKQKHQKQFQNNLKEKLLKDENDEFVVEEESIFLKFWHTYALGLQIIHEVKQSEKPIHALSELVNNFPLKIKEIASVNLSIPNVKAIKIALEELRAVVPEETTQLYVDGVPIVSEQLDLFSILNVLRTQQLYIESLEDGLMPYNEESGTFSDTTVSTQNSLDADKLRKIVSSLKRCQIPTVVAKSDMNPNKNSKASSPNSDSGTTRLHIDKGLILWMNNVEKDRMYMMLSKSLNVLLKNNFMESPFPRRNVFNMITLFDPIDDDGFEPIINSLRVYEQRLGVRFGVLVVDWKNLRPFTDTESVPRTLSAITMAVFRWASKSKALSRIVYSIATSGLQGEAALEVAVAANGRVTIDSLMEQEDFKSYYRHIQTYVYNFGIRNLPLYMMNGYIVNNKERSVVDGLDMEFPNMKKWVSTGLLKEKETDIYGWIMNETKAVKRYQNLVYENREYIPMTEPKFTTLMMKSSYLYSAEYRLEAAFLTNFLVLPSAIELFTWSHLLAAMNMVKHMWECGNDCVRVRSSIVFSDIAGNDIKISPVAAVIYHVMEMIKDKRNEKRVGIVYKFMTDLVVALEKGDFITKLGSDEANVIIQRVAATHGINNDITIRKERISTGSWLIRILSKDKTFSGPLLISNGRVIALDDSFISADYSLLEGQEIKNGEALMSCSEKGELLELYAGVMNSDDIGSDFIATKVSVIHSVVLLHKYENEGATNEEVLEAPEEFVLRQGDESRARHHISAIINPMKREAQRIASIVSVLSDSLDVSTTVILNPSSDVRELPIQSFYRYVFDTPQFNVDGSTVTPVSFFSCLPSNIVFTMGVDEPEPWMVFASKADEDLDNIRLMGIQESTVNVEYDLRSILVTGKVVDVVSKVTPKSLPIVIQHPTATSVVKGEGLPHSETVADTIVMANFGYFQLPVQPGLWDIRIQAGPKAEKYAIVDAIDTVTNVYSRPITRLRPVSSRVSDVFVFSFAGSFINLQVTSDTTPEHEKMEKERAEQANAYKARKEKPTLNIFTIASGHLYERFMRMMMYTTVRASNSTWSWGISKRKIKFWIIENFLSPTFKKFLPPFAAKHGFEYQLISYKWPHWLHRQTDKQRTIWGYKILFLDVLFPLDLEKVIYVDADQIVQADLHKLYNMDLGGAPVAYTPFCQKNANPHTKGFRFWESGFWVSHLNGKPYHISAIYVVDLVELRRSYGGDQYRILYDGLSKDPNSLANLDQDLPNFAQHQVPIFSLPEEWLWCETWCNEESKSSAMTIDLCNNPQTKIPKLENAKKIIPEWEELDKKLSEI